MPALIIIVAIVLIVLIFYSSNKAKKAREEVIQRKKNFVESFSPNARIIVNNDNYLFFMDDEKQVFGIDDSGTTYSYSGLRSISTGRNHVHISHNNASWRGLEIGKSVTSGDAVVPLDSTSISAITNEMLLILRKNLYERLSALNITPTHEYINKGVIWGCDINSRMFYCTYASIQIYDFSKLSSVKMEDFSDNPNLFGYKYRIDIAIKDQDIDMLITLDDETTLNDLLAMFKGIKNRQNDYPISIEQNDFDMMEGHDFEYFCAQLLRNNGYQNVEVTQGSGDQGIDIIAYRDGIKYGIQCKCYSSDIGNKAVQEVFAGKTYYACHVGVVLTNRYFTKSAVELAEKNGVLLWDRNKLLSMM